MALQAEELQRHRPAPPRQRGPPALHPRLCLPDGAGHLRPRQADVQARRHYNPAGIAALRTLVQKECIEQQPRQAPRGDGRQLGAQDPRCRKEPHDGRLAGGQAQGPQGERPGPAPQDGHRLPRRPQGPLREEYTVAVGCWDAHNNPLDLKALKLGMGSIIQPIVNANLFVSKTVNGFPQPQARPCGRPRPQARQLRRCSGPRRKPTRMPSARCSARSSRWTRTSRRSPLGRPRCRG
jgi:hypothetical protein